MPKIMSRKTCIFLKKTWIPYKGARSQALRAITGAHAKNMIPRPNPSWNEEKNAVAKNTKKRCFQRSLWTRRTKRADASRDASKNAHKIAAVFHVWRHLCTERHVVRQHLLRGTIATEVESVILRGSEKKLKKLRFRRTLWTRRTKRAGAWRAASEIAPEITPNIHLWRLVCMERHMVRRHGARRSCNWSGEGDFVENYS